MTSPIPAVPPVAPAGYVLISPEQSYSQLQSIATDVASIKSSLNVLADLASRITTLENRIAGYMMPLAAGGGAIGVIASVWQSIH